MSLRVLLADESPSIKKAFELALQDYGVKIQIVQQGVDIKELFQSFSPDICFMDILLPKLNGYDACTELKADPSSKNTPVVLMWSGFMELDKAKYASSQANGDLEKPFETDTLRALVQNLVPKLGSNELSDHIVMDNLMIEEDGGAEQAPPVDIPGLEVGALETPDLPSLSDFELEGEDTDVSAMEADVAPLDIKPLNVNSPSAEAPDFDDILNISDDLEEGDAFAVPEGLDFNLSDSSEDEWTDQPAQDNLAPEGLDDVDSFSVQSLAEDELPFDMPDDLGDDAFSAPEGLDFNLPPTPDKAPEMKTESAPIEEVEPVAVEAIAETTDSVQPLKSEETSSVPPLKKAEDIPVNIQVPQLSKEELKRLILAQSRDIIESVVWDVVPELAKEMIQKEIQRLTGEVKFDGDLR